LERYYFDRHVEPEFGRRPIDELTRAELQVFINRMGDEHSPSTARQCRVVLQRLYALAQWQEITDANPCQHVHAPKDKERDRVLTDKELQAVWGATALPLAGDFHMSPSIAVALRLLVVTMQRRSEVAGMHTSEIDRAKRLWTLPGERTKNHLTHTVPLSETALELIDSALALAGKKAGYLFPSPRDSKIPVTKGSLTKAFGLLVDARRIVDVRLHDLRRTAATHLTGERIGVPRFIVSRVLNQVSDTGGAAIVTKVYDRNQYLSEKRRALEAWAALLPEIVSFNAGRSML
jgi:integrase